MNKTRIGKIARLPRTVRSELNRRLHDGERGDRLVEWLNALPEVQAVLAADFDGRPINAQNLSDWKRGGYRDWLAQQEALELAERLGEDTAELGAGDPPLTDTLALWMAARYAVATRRVAESEGAESWHLLRELCADIVELRRGDHSAQRLRMERERFDFERARERERTEVELMAWAREHRDEFCKGWLPSDERMARVRRVLFGDPPNPVPGADPPPEKGCRGCAPAATGCGEPGDQAESSPIKPEDEP